MKTPFVQPRFVGPRFDEHTLPLAVARDLAAYETLVVELAKNLYLKDHPERQRVPKGFVADFQLHLDKIEDGSSRPLLSLITAGALALGSVNNDYLERARDLISECIASVDGNLPSDFPRELLFYFNQVGSSLNDNEQMELARTGGSSAILTPDSRKKLVLKADAVYERPIELNGYIAEANWEKSSFQLRLLDGTLVVIPMPEHFHGEARKFGGKNRHMITVTGIGTFDSWDRLQKVVSVDLFEVQPDYALAARLDELGNLKDGWYDGGGIAPDKSKLTLLAAKIVGHFPEKVPLPYIIPTPQGNLLLEWNAPNDPSVDLFLSDWRAVFHSFGPQDSDLQQEFDLTRQEEWARLFTFLSQHIPS